MLTMTQELQMEQLNQLFESKSITAQQLLWGRAEIRRVAFQDLYKSVELRKQELDEQLKGKRISKGQWLKRRHQLDAQIQPCIGCMMGVCRYGL